MGTGLSNWSLFSIFCRLLNRFLIGGHWAVQLVIIFNILRAVEPPPHRWALGCPTGHYFQYFAGCWTASSEVGTGLSNWSLFSIFCGLLNRLLIGGHWAVQLVIIFNILRPVLNRLLIGWHRAVQLIIILNILGAVEPPPHRRELGCATVEPPPQRWALGCPTDHYFQYFGGCRTASS